MAPRIETRLFVEEDLAENATVGLDHGRAHFLRSVLRLARGARLALFNGRDGEWLARLDGLGKGWASLVVERRLRAQEKAFLSRKKAREREQRGAPGYETVERDW